MGVQHENPIQDMIELELNHSKEADLFGKPDIFGELRTAEEEIHLGDFAVFVGVARATLHLELSGCDIVPGTRLNDESSTNTPYQLERQVASGYGRSAGFGAVLGAEGASRPAVKASFDAATSIAHAETLKQSTARHYVVSRPGKKWEIRDPNKLTLDQPLVETLLANDRICQVERRDGANSISVTGSIRVKRRDLTFRTEGNSVLRELRNLTQRERFMKAVVAKALVENNGTSADEQQMGSLLVSKSTIATDE
jgi:hypothetical protein